MANDEADEEEVDNDAEVMKTMTWIIMTMTTIVGRWPRQHLQQASTADPWPFSASIVLITTLHLA